MMTEPQIRKGPNPVQKGTYKRILSLYDISEKVLKLVEDGGEDATPYVKSMERMSRVMERQISILVDNFFNYMESSKPLSGVEKLRMEKALEAISESMQEFLKKLRAN